MKTLVAVLLLLSACGERVSYVTAHGMQVQVGVHNDPGPRRVEHLTDATMFFWRLQYPHLAGCIYQVPSKVFARFIDEDEVEPGIAGLCQDDLTIIMANLPYRDDVFIHELSHAILWDCTEPRNGNGDHAIFKEADLCRIQTECV